MHDFINLDPSAYAIRRFRRYCFGTMALCGLLFAHATVDERLVCDEWYMRPDLMPYKAMVAKEDLDITERTAYEAKY